MVDMFGLIRVAHVSSNRASTKRVRLLRAARQVMDIYVGLQCVLISCEDSFMGKDCRTWCRP